MTDFMNAKPSLPLTATEPPQVSAEAMERFMSYRYPDPDSADGTGFQPASARTWYKDIWVWPKQGSLPQREVEAIMDEAVIDNSAWGVPLWGCKVMLHPVSHSIAVELPNSKNILLNHSYEFQDRAYGAVATKLEPAGTCPGFLFYPSTRLFFNNLEFASNQPLQSWAQSKGWETVRDFGDSDITIILDSSAYRADEPHSSSSDHEHQDYEGSCLSSTYYDPRYNPAGTESEQGKLFAMFSRQVLKCKKSKLSEQSKVFQEFIAARPHVRLHVAHLECSANKGQIETIVINDILGRSIGDGDAEVIMAELVSFMHTGEVTRIAMSNTDNLKIRDRKSHTHSHVQYYLKIFKAALEYGVKDLPAAIESIIKNEINWAPGIADIQYDGQYGEPSLKRVVEEVYYMQCFHGESVQSLKKVMLQKWAREISNISGITDRDYEYEGEEFDDEGGIDGGAPGDGTCSHLEDLRERYRGMVPGQGFHEDLRQALEAVKQDDEEVVAIYEGSGENGRPLPNYRLRKRSPGTAPRPRLSKL
jgi:hypothetical protein